MTAGINNRKLEHIHVINADEQVDRRKFYFDTIRLGHRALPELNLQEVDPSVTFMGKQLSFPLLISSMTGGDDDLLRKVNRNLAIAAETCRIAMGVGSQRVMFLNPAATASFAIRKFAPTTVLFSNLGAVQLNYGFTLAHCEKAIDVVQADGLYFHLNPLQEAVQPEGDTNFAGLVDKITTIARHLARPVLLKEVGAGMSTRDVELVIASGIKYIDVAGTGGTSWSRIEHHRQGDENANDIGIKFQDWGIPTPLALTALKPYRDRITLIASGGLRSGIDMVKAVILGASLCGLAKPFLRAAMESADQVIQVIKILKREFQTAMFLLGIPNIAQLFGNESLILSY